MPDIRITEQFKLWISTGRLLIRCWSDKKCWAFFVHVLAAVLIIFSVGSIIGRIGFWDSATGFIAYGYLDVLDRYSVSKVKRYLNT